MKYNPPKENNDSVSYSTSNDNSIKTPVFGVPKNLSKLTYRILNTLADNNFDRTCIYIHGFSREQIFKASQELSDYNLADIWPAPLSSDGRIEIDRVTNYAVSYRYITYTWIERASLLLDDIVKLGEEGFLLFSFQKFSDKEGTYIAGFCNSK